MKATKKKGEKSPSKFKPTGLSQIVGKKIDSKTSCKIPIKSPGSREKTALPNASKVVDKKGKIFLGDNNLRTPAQVCVQSLSRMYGSLLFAKNG